MMKHSIQKKIGILTGLILMLFVLIGFVVSYGCIQHVGTRYREAAASEALDFAETVINADKAKETFTTRNKASDYDTVQSVLAGYQAGNSDIIRRISLVHFSNSFGSYIYDTGGARLAERLDYDDYTTSVKAVLMSGHDAFTHARQGYLSFYRPLRTMDDTLCGYLIVTLEQPFEVAMRPTFFAAFGGLLAVGILCIVLVGLTLNRNLFRPIRKITDAAVYLSGDDSASGGKDAAVMFDTKRQDEIGRLSAALQKIFFDMNTGAEHLSQALYDANHDGMTQHLNKRCYHSMEEKFRQCDPICVIYFDVNNLKLMNDTLGHEQGDYVIKRAADYIRELLGQGDYCFRMGGDEFLMVMTECTFRSADAVMRKLDADAPFILNRDSDEIKCALSYGCAFAKGEHSYAEVLTEAEENMYAKKTELKELLQMPER